MMAGVSEEVKKRILKQYYENMYEDEDADQEYFDSIRNVNHDVQGEELNDGGGQRKRRIQSRLRRWNPRRWMLRRVRRMASKMQRMLNKMQRIPNKMQRYQTKCKGYQTKRKAECKEQSINRQTQGNQGRRDAERRQTTQQAQGRQSLQEEHRAEQAQPPSS